MQCRHAPDLVPTAVSAQASPYAMPIPKQQRANNHAPAIPPKEADSATGTRPAAEAKTPRPESVTELLDSVASMFADVLQYAEAADVEGDLAGVHGDVAEPGAGSPMYAQLAFGTGPGVDRTDGDTAARGQATAYAEIDAVKTRQEAAERAAAQRSAGQSRGGGYEVVDPPTGALPTFAGVPPVADVGANVPPVAAVGASVRPPMPLPTGTLANAARSDGQEIAVARGPSSPGRVKVNRMSLCDAFFFSDELPMTPLVPPGPPPIAEAAAENDGPVAPRDKLDGVHARSTVPMRADRLSWSSSSACGSDAPPGTRRVGNTIICEDLPSHTGWQEVMEHMQHLLPSIKIAYMPGRVSRRGRYCQPAALPGPSGPSARRNALWLVCRAWPLAQVARHHC